MAFKKLTTEEFIQKAQLIHGNRYDYSVTNYINNATEVEIICREHGIFKQRPSNHFNTRGCHACGHRKSKEKFVEEAKRIHEEKYDYSKVVYTGTHNKVIIVCPKHGEFSQKPLNHISLKQGCPKCKASQSAARWEDERWVKEIKKSRVNAVRKKYGVDNVMHVSELAERAMHNSSKWKPYALPSGKVLKVQGYEPKALDELLQIYEENEILSSRKDMPKIMYMLDGKIKRYYPDFYIPKDNLIIEVKCKYTLINEKQKNRAKFEATLALGFKFKLLVYN